MKRYIIGSLKISQQIGASVCSGFCTHDALIGDHFEFTMRSIATLTQSKLTRTQCELKWYTGETQPNKWKLILCSNTILRAQAKHTVRLHVSQFAGITGLRATCYIQQYDVTWRKRMWNVVCTFAVPVMHMLYILINIVLKMLWRSQGQSELRDITF